MKIGELAGKTGLAASAIRFYEEQGLIAAPARGANGYRDYDESALRQLQIVVTVQKLGLSLESIRRMFSDDGVCSKAQTLRQIESRLDDIKALESVLAAQKKDIRALKTVLETSLKTGIDPRCPGNLKASPQRPPVLPSAPASPPASALHS